MKRSPRTRLIDERKRHNWTQQELADRIGTTQRNVSRWESGLTTPSFYFRAQLSQHFGLSSQEVDVLLAQEDEKRQPHSPPISSNSSFHFFVPSPRNPFFTGREHILETLYDLIHTNMGQAVALTQSYALHGLGGIGKTQLALEYAYHYAADYSAVFWIKAETVEQVTASLFSIADLLQLPEREEADQQRIITAVQRWLISSPRWLLIWDNLEDLELLQRFLPPRHQGTILITTRHQALGPLARSIPLSPMEPEEGLLFLLRRAKVLGLEASIEHAQQLALSQPNEYTAAQTLTSTMAGLPLALDQAGAYIEETGCSLQDYQRRYQQQELQLLNRRGISGGDHPQSVVTTFLLASEQAARESPEAAHFLQICAFLQAEAIPEEIFSAGAAHLGQELVSLTNEPTQFDMIITILRRLSLIQRQSSTHTFSIHRLVQAVLRWNMSEQEQALWLKRAITTLNYLFPAAAGDTRIETEVWKQCERLLPHVLSCLTFVPKHLAQREISELLHKAADYLRGRAQYEEAEQLYLRALRCGEEALTPEDPQMVSILNGLATLYREQGQYERAEPLFLRALHLREQALGPNHMLIAYPLSELAILYAEQGHYERAEPLFLRALHLWEQALAPEDPQVAYALNNLAELRRRLGQFEQAEPLFLRAIHIREHALGPEHVLVAYPLHNLAVIYHMQNKNGQAERLLQRALHILEQTLGTEHPQLADSLICLANIYADRSHQGQAELFYQRARHILEQTLGSEHPKLAMPLYDLADLYREQGRYTEAESLFLQALSILQQAQHHLASYPLEGLGQLYQEQGLYDRAQSLYNQALHTIEQTLGAEDPQLISVLNSLGDLYTSQKHYTEAEHVYQRALHMREGFLEERQAESAQTLHNLAFLRWQQGRLNEALSFADQAQRLRAQALGNDHPKTLATRTLYTQLVQAHEPHREEEPLDH